MRVFCSLACDVWLADGSLRWLTGDGGLASDVILDASVLSDGSTLAVGGYFSDSIVYSCPTCFGGTLTLTSAGGLDAYIATYNISSTRPRALWLMHLLHTSPRCLNCHSRELRERGEHWR